MTKLYVFTLLTSDSFNSEQFILDSINTDIESSLVFAELADYADIFSAVNVRKLSKHKGSDYAIEVKESTQLSYNLLYNLLSNKLKILFSYLNKILKKE